MILTTAGLAWAADTVPPVIDLPGTQPGEIGNLESPNKCDNCHGGYDQTAEHAFNWRGSMMGNAGRDPLFWATLAVAEQDFDGAGDLCIRCHSTGGWIAGRSTPTDSSGLQASDDDGVDCELCHKMVTPNDSEYSGAQNLFFPANDPLDSSVGFFGSGMFSLFAGSEKIGPYDDASARHQMLSADFHRDRDFCGTCHDVSNSAVGHYAPNHGAQDTVKDPGEEILLDGPRTHPEPDPIMTALGDPSPQAYVALNNPPYKYGVVERTFSEFKAGLISQTLVSDYGSLPAELQAGALQAGYESAMLTAPNGPNYEDNEPRYFSCQTCHLRPITGAGCNKKGTPVRTDLPLHDMTGGAGYWVPDVIKYQNSAGTLRLGGDMTAVQLAALDAGKARAMKQLSEAGSLTVTGDSVQVTNLTGHKLITGYPEGRRMWLNVKWYDGVSEVPIREDGEWGPVTSIVFDDGTGPASYQVNSLKDPYDPNSKVYEAHYGMTQDWAALLVSLGYPTNMALSYDRYTGGVDYTLGDLAGAPAGTEHETFHFVLNNVVTKDNRIPPYGMSYDIAKNRNALPVPAAQYGSPSAGGTYEHFDDLTLDPPAAAAYATIDLVYQATSWEYIQFLWLANDKTNPTLGAEGDNMLDAWLKTGMSAPYVIASATWGSAPQPKMSIDSTTTWSVNKQGNLVAQTNAFGVRDTVAVQVHAVDGSGAGLSGVQVFIEITQGGTVVKSLQGFTDATGNAVVTWKTGRNDAGSYVASVVNAINTGYEFDGAIGDTSEAFTVQ
jgi:hypothetical protein